MRVNRVIIENFKRFESVQVDLRDFDCLVGAKGASINNIYTSEC